MVNPTTVHKIKPSLNDMVYCANCGAAMAQTGQRYYCPNTSVDSGRNCPTKPVHADHLRYTVINELLNRLARMTLSRPPSRPSMKPPTRTPASSAREWSRLRPQ